MTTYLAGGWYQPGAKKSLRTEVIDGAMDAAGYLHRAGVSSNLMNGLALKARSIMTLVDPQMRGVNGFSVDQREVITRRITEAAEGPPELVGFVADCLEHVGSTTDLLAFYLHLIHVTRMMQLLITAQTTIGLMPAALMASTSAPAAKAKAKTKAKPKSKSKPKAKKKAAPAKKSKSKRAPAKKRKSPRKRR